MQVHVTLKGILADRLPGGQDDIELDERSTVDDVAVLLALPDGLHTYVVNGTAVRSGTRLQDSDRLLVFPPMAGGR